MTRNFKILCAALLLAGCVENTAQTKTVTQHTAELSTFTDNVMSQCIEFAANGTEPSETVFAQSGYSERRPLGIPVYVRSASGKNSLFDDTFAAFRFTPNSQSCLFTATGVGGGVWLVGGNVRNQLSAMGWTETPSDSRTNFIFSRGSKTIVMKGWSTGGQSQILLKPHEG